MSNQLQIIEQNIISIKPKFEENITALGLKQINFNKELAFAMQKMEENVYIQRLPIESIVKSVLNVSLTGLSLNPVLKEAYLVPRKGQCCLDPSYMGLIKVVTDTGSVKNIEANIVYWGEPFQIERGTNPFVKHGIIEDPNTKKGPIRGAYSKAILNDGSTAIEWMDADQLMSIMNRSESVKKGNNSPWKTDPDEMCRKTVVKRHWKYLPKSERAILAANAIDIDHDNNGIDFEKESREDAPINIDTIEPTEENKQKFEQMFQGLMQPHVPADYLGGQSKEDFITDIRNELHAGVLSVEKGEKIYNYVLSFFQR